MTIAEQEALYRILADQAARYPQMQVRDLYKLLHQSAMGSEHAVGDTGTAHSRLEREIASLGDGPDDPLVDPISPNGHIVRMHLRPYVHAGRDLERLLAAFIQTANEWHGSPEYLQEYGTVAASVVKDGLLPISGTDMVPFWAEQEARGYPAVHHSEIYEHLYHPAYRVVAREFMEDK